jgi:hypothetical protein
MSPLVAQVELEKLTAQVQAQWGQLCFFLGFFLVLIFALGIVLRTAVSLFNTLAGGKDSGDSVPMPTMMGSILMVFLSFVVTGALVGAILWAATNLAMAVQLNASELAMYSGLGTILLFFVVLSVLLALFLPAPIFRSAIIAILCVPVGIVLFVLFLALLWVISIFFQFTVPAFQRFPFGK